MELPLGCSYGQGRYTYEANASTAHEPEAAAGAGENMRKESFFNYESPALTPELQARRDPKVKHSKPQVINREWIR